MPYAFARPASSFLLPADLRIMAALLPMDILDKLDTDHLSADDFLNEEISLPQSVLLIPVLRRRQINVRGTTEDEVNVYSLHPHWVSSRSFPAISQYIIFSPF